MRFCVAAFVLAIAFLPLAAGAAPTIYIVPQITSTGAGGKIAIAVDGRTDVSVGIGSFVYHQQQTFNNNEADISTSVSFVERLQLNAIPISVDRRIGSGPLTFSLGVVLNNNHLGASSIPFTENVTIAGTVYSAATAGQAFADVHWRHVDPYVGFAYAPRRGGLTVGVGAFFEGKPVVDIYETGAIAANRNAIAKYISSFETQLRQALGPVSVYPEASVGYRLRI
jgi:hypothetical protein